MSCRLYSNYSLYSPFYSLKKKKRVWTNILHIPYLYNRINIAVINLLIKVKEGFLIPSHYSLVFLLLIHNHS